MVLQLNHQKLDVFNAAKSFTLECYRFTKLLPAEEKFNMTQQLRRASLSVYLNIAEGCSRKSAVERKIFTYFLSCVCLNVSAQDTLPLGWNSYNCFGSAVHEDEVKANADYMAQHVNIALFNFKDTSSNISFDFTDIGLEGKAAIRDIWERSDRVFIKKNFSKQLMRMALYCYALHRYKSKNDEEVLVAIHPDECI